MHDLGTLGGTYSQGYGVNDAGQVVGRSNPTGNTSLRAFRYDGTPGSGGVMRDLGTLGGTSSSGRAINSAGQVAGYSNIAGGDRRAFRYDGTPGSGGVMHDLGTLPLGVHSEGYGINDARHVVGWSNGYGDPQIEHAFLYTGTPFINGQMIDLDVWLDDTDPTEGAKWTLTRAFDISNTGWITGVGDYNDGAGGLSDGRRAFLLDASSLVPEPGGMALFLAAGAIALRRRA